MGDAQIGRDVVLKEKEPQTKLLQLLPKKAQLGFFSLKDYFSQKNETGVKRFLHSPKPHDSVRLEYTCIDASADFIALGFNFGILFFYDRKLGRLQRFSTEVRSYFTFSLCGVGQPRTDSLPIEALSQVYTSA